MKNNKEFNDQIHELENKLKSKIQDLKEKKILSNSDPLIQIINIEAISNKNRVQVNDNYLKYLQSLEQYLSDLENSPRLLVPVVKEEKAILNKSNNKVKSFQDVKNNPFKYYTDNYLKDKENNKDMILIQSFLVAFLSNNSVSFSNLIFNINKSLNKSLKEVTAQYANTDSFIPIALSNLISTSFLLIFSFAGILFAFNLLNRIFLFMTKYRNFSNYIKVQYKLNLKKDEIEFLKLHERRINKRLKGNYKNKIKKLLKKD